MKQADEKQPDYLGHRQRVRDKFLTSGGKSMPDYEFLELLLMMSIPRRDVKPIAKNLIRKFGNFAEVVNADTEDLLACEGIKETSVALLKAVKEAALRLQSQNLLNMDKPIINNMDVLVDYLRSSMAYSDVEQFNVIYLDSKLRLIEEETMQRGTNNMVSLHVREVIKNALAKEAGGIIIAHNHPSGDVTPSKADVEITNMVQKACESVKITFIDHLIVSKNRIYSFMRHQEIF